MSELVIVDGGNEGVAQVQNVHVQGGEQALTSLPMGASVSGTKRDATNLYRSEISRQTTTNTRRFRKILPPTAA